MKEVFAQVRTVQASFNGEIKQAYTHVFVWCPGCDGVHSPTIEVFNDYKRSDGSPWPVWSFNQNLEKPTFEPSILVYGSVHICRNQHTFWVCPSENGGECEDRSHLMGYELLDGSVIAPKVHQPVPMGAKKVRVHTSDHPVEPSHGNCHSFLRDGVWEFLPDSAHDLAGQRVPVVSIPKWWLKR